MGRKSKLVVQESELELKKLISKQIKDKNKDRLKSLLFIKTNKFETRELLSLHLGYHIRTMEKWLAKYKEGGLKDMLIPNYLERKSNIVTSEMHKGLSNRVHDSENGFSSYVEAQNWVEQEFGVKMNYHWLREYMIKRFKTKIKQPRKSHVKKNEQAIEAFLKTT
jgi:transposase